MNMVDFSYAVSDCLIMDILPLVGQSVWVKIPDGILRHMHICGLAFKK